MKLTRPSDVRDLLAELDFRPSKALGQNFLIDANILRIIVDAAELAPDDVVLEVGPGLGVLTAPLLSRAKRVVAIEKDERLFAHLAELFAGATNLELIKGDALDANLPSLGVSKVVANLPYSIGSRLLMSIFEADEVPECVVVTVQFEVAERLTAQPGTKDYGLITVWAQARYEASIRKVISPTCFFPPPQVKSAVVVLQRRDPPMRIADPQAFRDLVKRAFTQRRKQIGTILGRSDELKVAGIAPRSRPEDLSVDDWRRLSNAFTPG